MRKDCLRLWPNICRLSRGRAYSPETGRENHASFSGSGNSFSESEIIPHPQFEPVVGLLLAEFTVCGPNKKAGPQTQFQVCDRCV